MSIKAIQTAYKGYRFRSRLEARWAVFFDSLGVPWEYEKEGYELKAGRYLPDFWLPDLECWVEIKPVWPTDGEKTLAVQLADMTDHPAVIIAGAPGYEALLVYCADTTDSSGGEGWWEDSSGSVPHWSAVRGECCICSGNNHHSRDFFTPSYSQRWEGMKIMQNCDCFDGCVPGQRILDAYVSARGARFEFGE